VRTPAGGRTASRGSPCSIGSKGANQKSRAHKDTLGQNAQSNPEQIHATGGNKKPRRLSRGKTTLIVLGKRRETKVEGSYLSVGVATDL